MIYRKFFCFCERAAAPQFLFTAGKLAYPFLGEPAACDVVVDKLFHYLPPSLRENRYNVL